MYWPDREAGELSRHAHAGVRRCGRGRTPRGVQSSARDPGRWPAVLGLQTLSSPPASLQDWSSNPMFERKDNKKDALLDLDGRLVTLNKRYTVVKDAGVKIQAMVAVRTRPGAPGTGEMRLVQG